MRVFAHWYSGTLKLPQGKQVDCFPANGRHSGHEREQVFGVERGVLQKVWFREYGSCVDRRELFARNQSRV